MTRWLLGGGLWLLVVLVAGVLPYVMLIDQLPWGADASKWVERGSLDAEGWADWVFTSKHFVGYRPITALSFTANQAITGYAPWGYRLLDLALHGATGLLVIRVYRRITGDGSAFAVVPLLVLFGHPATEEVVPYVARRSYLLATCFGLSGLLLVGRAIGCHGWRRGATSLIAAGALGLAVLSNEVAYVLLPLLPFVVLHLGGRSALPTIIAPWLVCGATAWLRQEVLGSWSGGYHKRYFASLARGHTPAWRELSTWEPRRIVEAAWTYTLHPHPVGGPGAGRFWHQGGWVTVTVGLAMAWLLWFCLVRPVLYPDDRAARSPAVLAVWMIGATAIIVLSQTWFWRQAYMLLPPLGIVLGIALRSGWDAARAGRWIGALDGGVALGILLSVLVSGPLLRGGMDRRVHRPRSVGTEIVHQIAALTADLEGPGRVWLALPLRSSSAHMVRLWGDRLGASRGLEHRLLAHRRGAGIPGGTGARIRGDGPEGRRVTLGEGMIWAPTGQIRAMRPKASGLPLDRLARTLAATYVIVGDFGSFALVDPQISPSEAPRDVD